MKLTFIEFLMEDKIEYITKNQGDKLLAAYKKDKGTSKPKVKDAKDIVDALNKFNSKFLQWLVNQYLKNEFSLEDKARIDDDLTKFQKVKAKLDIKDINQYKSLSDLESALEPFEDEDTVSNRQADKAIGEKFVKDKEAKVFYKGDGLTIVIPNTEAASCYFGRGTKWCTAANKHNMFQHYNKTGKLYIVMTKMGKFQFHFRTGQFMDDKDVMITPELWRKLVDAYPVLIDLFDKMASKSKKYPLLPLIKDPTPEQIKTAIEDNPNWLNFVKFTPEEWFEILTTTEKSITSYIKKATAKKIPEKIIVDAIINRAVKGGGGYRNTTSISGLVVLLPKADFEKNMKIFSKEGALDTRNGEDIKNLYMAWADIKKVPKSLLNMFMKHGILNAHEIEAQYQDIDDDLLYKWATEKPDTALDSNLPNKFRERARWAKAGKGHKF